MRCRSCGMESRTPDVCEWCKKPINPTASGAPPAVAMSPGSQPTMTMPPAPPPPGAPVAQPTVAMPPQSSPSGAQPTTQMMPVTTRRRVSLTGEVVEDVAPVAPVAPMGAPNPMAGVIPPTAYDPRAVNAAMTIYQPTTGERWEKALAICLPLLALSMLLTHLVPGALLGLLYLDVFLLPLALGAMGAVPSFDDAFADCSVILILSVFLTPPIVLVAYLIVCAIKQECNGALVALLTICIVVPQLMLPAIPHNVDNTYAFLLFGLFNWFSFFAVFLGFLGWLASSFFRPSNLD